MNIRLSSATNPEKGVARLWERLDERFGSAEMVESDIKPKIEYCGINSLKNYMT